MSDAKASRCDRRLTSKLQEIVYLHVENVSQNKLTTLCLLVLIAKMELHCADAFHLHRVWWLANMAVEVSEGGEPLATDGHMHVGAETQDPPLYLVGLWHREGPGLVLQAVLDVLNVLVLLISEVKVSSA